ncbi:MAG: CopD family protein [Candidatus Promineifilaceae bacterium]|nr:CopD family protein [Candidatus Promineifilaceae bacterium]
MSFWVLVLSYWIHLLATVLWLGGLFLMSLIAWPALRRQTLAANQWFELQKRFTPWVNGSLVILLVTGFIQMTGDIHYEGFLEVNTLWAQAILVKHVAVAGMIVIGAVIQWRIHPEMERLALLSRQRPELAAEEEERLLDKEQRLLRLNLLLAMLVLFFTAVATAV